MTAKTRQNSDYIGIREAAAHLGISKRTFDRLLADRQTQLPVVRIGQQLRTRRDWLDAWAEERRGQ